ncbi:MAG TPA: hypothetical protein VFH26_01970 [Gemmatimonadales bacterium]|nr:hypothetical protein [Gemmatimonadales bacterium]
MHIVPVLDYAGLSANDRAAVEATVSGHTTLSTVLQWAGAAAIEEIVTQDEFTHDVLIPYEQGRYLAYDTT